VAAAVTLGIPTPAFSTALAFYDGYRLEKHATSNFVDISRLSVSYYYTVTKKDQNTVNEGTMLLSKAVLRSIAIF